MNVNLDRSQHMLLNAIAFLQVPMLARVCDCFCAIVSVKSYAVSG